MSKLGEIAWRLFDPVVRRIDARVEHYRSLERPRDQKAEEFASKALFDETVHLMPSAKILNKSHRREAINIGQYSHVAGELSAVCPGAKLSIGHNCFIGNGSRVWAAREIVIGNYVLISHLVDIHDNNSHPIDWLKRREDTRRLFKMRQPIDYDIVRSQPVVIEDDVWIGFKASIMKGVCIGARSIVASASVVLEDVPPDVIVAGNPAKIVRRLVPPLRNDGLQDDEKNSMLAVLKPSGKNR